MESKPWKRFTLFVFPYCVQQMEIADGLMSRPQPRPYISKYKVPSIHEK